MSTRVSIRDLKKRYVVWHNRPYSFKDALVARVKGTATIKEEFWAVRGVSFDIEPGEAVGIIGPNGSGKSTLLGIVGRVLRPTSGTVRVDGRISILMEAGIGFHDDLTGIENVYLSGALLGMRRREIQSKLDAIIDFADIHGFVDTPVRMLSSGMYMRLGFSVAVHLDPDILLVDEVLAVGDEAFHHKCRRRLAEFRNDGGAVMFVSHRMAEVQWLCNRAIWMQEGLIRHEGPTDEVVRAYVAEHMPEYDGLTECLEEPEGKTGRREDGKTGRREDGKTGRRVMLSLVPAVLPSSRLPASMKTPSTNNLFSDEDLQSMPLAARMRPRRLEDFVGQEHLVGPQALLRKALESDALPSMILVGPAGSGKSTLAMIVAGMTQHHFEPLSAVTSGVSDIRKMAAQAEERKQLHNRRTIVFIDEIHRLNKTQQDSLLPYVERGTFTLIGATTENPFFSLTTPLRSRCRLYQLQPLSDEQVLGLLQRALMDEERGLGLVPAEVAPEALEHLAEGSNGDARTALSALEMAVMTAQPDEQGGLRHVSLAAAEEALQRPVLKYDRAGDEHYDTISAFIKSMRGSDPDAAIYWLAKMLEAGEDPRFIARRIVIQAAEDVGLADPTALRVAIAAADAVEYVGLPEAQIPLAMATIHLATAPKSNSAYLAIAKAREDVAKEGAARVPDHLAGTARLDKSKQPYLYPHDHAGAWVAQDYLPPGLTGRRYYIPKDNRREQLIAEYLDSLRAQRDETAGTKDDQGEHTEETSG